MVGKVGGMQIVHDEAALVHDVGDVGARHGQVLERANHVVVLRGIRDWRPVRGGQL